MDHLRRSISGRAEPYGAENPARDSTCLADWRWSQSRTCPQSLPAVAAKPTYFPTTPLWTVSAAAICLYDDRACQFNQIAPLINCDKRSRYFGRDTLAVKMPRRE